MIRAGVTSCLLVLVGCAQAPVVREEWLRRVRPSGEHICSWSDARWEDRGPLLVTGTAFRLGRARSVWTDGKWAGAMVGGSLRRSGPVLVFDARFTRDGVTIEATVDVGEHPVFRAHEPVRFGVAGMVLKGGSLRLVEAAFGKALAQPAADALEPFAPVEPPLLELPCASLSLHGPEGGAKLEGRRAVAMAGFTEAPERWVPERASLEAAAAPGGEYIGSFVSKNAPVQGYVLAEAGAEARFAVPTPSGLIWVGWVQKDALQARPALEPAEEATPFPANEPNPPQAWRACADEELDLRVAVGERWVHAGYLSRNTRFVLGRRVGVYREVGLDAPWLELEPDVTLVVDASAAQCPQVAKDDL